MAKSEPKQRPGIMVYFEWFDDLASFSDDECGRFFRDMLNYGLTGNTPTYQDRALQVMWNNIQRRVDADAKRYEAQRQQRIDAINKRWRTEQDDESIRAYTDEYERIRNIPTTTTTTTPTTKSNSYVVTSHDATAAFREDLERLGLNQEARAAPTYHDPDANLPWR